MQSWDQDVARWESAGVVDPATAARIRAFEAAQDRPEGHRWGVLLALILGGILLGAGILLFVAAHWDEVSPLGRFALVMGILAALHLAAILAAERFPAMATVMHGVGTVGAGAAIAMVGQIFNMQEHWPAAVLLWALCALAGWYWLRDQFQLVCLLLLAPAWLICEWVYRAEPYQSQDVYLARILAVLAAAYLTAFLHTRMRFLFGLLFTLAGIGLVLVTGFLSDGWAYSWAALPQPPTSVRATALVLMLVIALAAFLYERRTLLPVLAVATMSFALPWLQVKINTHRDFGGGDYVRSEPGLLLYVLVAAVTLLLCWQGLQQRSRALVNYGIIAFALTVGWFYTSSIMDKLGRSLGLIGLGVLFLAGGWLLEKMRRRLLLRMQVDASVAEVLP